MQRKSLSITGKNNRWLWDAPAKWPRDYRPGFRPVWWRLRVALSTLYLRRRVLLHLSIWRG